MSMIKVDIDNKNINPKEIANKLLFIENQIKVRFKDIQVFETAKGFHLYFQFVEELNDYVVIILQMFLGSDMNREMMNLGRVMRGIKHWNVLFYEKRRMGITISREVEMEDIRQKILKEYAEQMVIEVME